MIIFKIYIFDLSCQISACCYLYITAICRLFRSKGAICNGNQKNGYNYELFG